MTRRTPQRRGRILIVEDDVVSARALAQLLRSDGYEVETAFDGAAAIARLSRLPAVDALIVDYQLPHVVGTAVAAYARSIAPGIHVVVVTGYAERMSKVFAPARVLPKPLVYAELAADLEHYFDARAVG